MKKILIILVISIVVLAGCTTSIYDAEITYTIPEVPATEGGVVTYETQLSGMYVIGSSPSEYVTGNEKEFTTAESGKYIAGQDFPAGTYDLVAVSGSGNVFSSGNEQNVMGLNEIMSSETGKYYVTTYDNYTFAEGEELEVSGVSLKLVPQNTDTYVIEPGQYDLVATGGSGNVFSSGNSNDAMGLNEIMSVDPDEYSVATYDNYTFEEGEVLEVSGVSLELNGELPPTEAIPAFDVTETLEFNAEPSDGEPDEICTTDITGTIEEVECSELAEYEALKADIDAQMSK